MATRRRVTALREWTEDCRILQHRHCEHIGTAGTVGILGVRTFVTICPCACHVSCRAATVELHEVAGVCDCRSSGEERQRHFEASARPPALRRIFTRHRQIRA